MNAHDLRVYLTFIILIAVTFVATIILITRAYRTQQYFASQAEDPTNQE